MEITHFSLFSGVGGIDLAAEWAGFQTVGQCELADYPYKVLCKHWPDVPKWRDIRDVTAESIKRAGIENITLLSGGFPCQPHSVAGKHKGSLDERDLWPEYRRVISEVKPRWVLGENVPGLLSSDDRRFFGNILRDLAEMGYSVGWCVFGACDVGAPHKRDRLFVVAYSGCQLQPGAEFKTEDGMETGTEDAYKFERPSKTRYVAYSKDDMFARGRDARTWWTGLADGSKTLADTCSAGQQERNPSGKSDYTGHCSGSIDTGRPTGTAQCGLGGVSYGISAGMDGHRWPAGLGQPQYDWEPPRVATGIKNRTNRLKCLGNAVVPQQCYPILKAIYEIENCMEKVKK